MTLETDTVTAPAYWASALVNGDLSGMEDEEIAAMEAYFGPLKAEGWYVVGVVRDEDGEGQEPWFTWSFDLYGGTAKGGDILDYVIHRQVPKST